MMTQQEFTKKLEESKDDPDALAKFLYDDFIEPQARELVREHYSLVMENLNKSALICGLQIGGDDKVRKVIGNTFRGAYIGVVLDFYHEKLKEFKDEFERLEKEVKK